MPLHADLDLLVKRRDVDGLVEVLRNDPQARTSTWARAAIARALGKTGREEASPALVSLLLEHDDGGDVRRAAAMSLGRTGGRAAVAALGQAVTAAEATVACWAARSLGEIGDEAGLASLLVGVVRPEPIVRAFSAEALGRLPMSTAAGDALVAALDDSSRDVRTGTASGIAQLGDGRLLAALERAADREWRFGYTRRYLRMQARRLREQRTVIERGGASALEKRGGGRRVSAWWANHTQGRRAVGGRLELTNQRLMFRPSLFERVTGGRGISIPLDEIREVGREPARGWNAEPFSGGARTRLRVDLRDGTSQLFVVRRLDDVAATIAAAVRGATWTDESS